MKLKSLIIISTSALLSATFVPVASAQDEGPGVDRPFHNADGRGGPGFRPGPDGERRPGPGHHRHRRPGGDPGRLIDDLDANGDGFVDVDEFLDGRIARVDDVFDRRDVNGDGLLSEEEAGPPPRRRPDRDPTEREQVIACVRETIADWEGPHGVEDRFDAVDLDGDGYIDLAELSMALEQRALELFDRIDSNVDGLISLEEVAAHQQAQINLRRVIRACVDEITDPFDTTL